MPRMTQAEADAYERRMKAMSASWKEADEHTESDEGLEWKLRQKCIKLLRDKGWLVFCGTVKREMGRTPGEPDLVCFGRKHSVLLIELKSKNGKLSPEQQQIKTVLEDFGHDYHIVRSVAHLEIIMEILT